MNKNFSLKGFQLILIIVIASLVGYFFGTREVSVKWKNYLPIASVSPRVPPPTQGVDFTLLYSVLDKINRDYFDKSKIDSTKLLYGAISGMLMSLDDPYTSFFPPKENTAFKTQMAGEFSGIGAELGMKDKKIIVMSPIDGSPAQKAGIKSGDFIVAVDGNDTYGWDIGKAVENIRGPKGSSVKLSVLHEGAKKPTDITIVRDSIKVDSVTSWVKKVSCEGDSCKEVTTDCPSCSTIGYIRISQFGDRTNEEWTAKINTMYNEFKKNSQVKGVVLDLRNNPGGYLNDAVFIAGEFIKKGQVVVMQEDGSGQRTEMRVDRDGMMLDKPLVVLINKGSASASEIVSGALRDHKRAKLVGDNSFGKGTVQQAIDVENGASIHLSIAKWLTPNGTWVHKKGLEPDIVVSFDEKKSPAGAFDNQLQAAIQQLIR